MSTARWSICTLILMLLHGVGESAQARAALADPPRAPEVVIASAQDPRVLQAVAAMEAVRQLGRPPGLRAPGLRPTLAAGEDIEDPFGGGGPGGGSGTSFGWAPYAGTWDLDDAGHLLRRAHIGARFEDMVAARDQGLAATLAGLLTPQAPPAPPGAWITEPPPDWPNLTQQQLDQLVDDYLERQHILILWWVDRIANHQSSLTEQMTFFYHDHFATGAETVFFPQAIYGQMALLRQHSLGNFRTLTRALCTDPAMLLWLNGDGNTVTSPNENFARELLELFTMGEGSGYTQQDVEEAARACTGYVTDGVTTYFVPQWHDNGEKTILGRTGNWGMDELVDILFEQPATARYLCTKLYTWFLDDQPAVEDAEGLAATLRMNDYEIVPVLAQLFGSDQFYRDDFRGSLVKSPVDLVAGQVRALHASGFDPLTSVEDYEIYWVRWQMWDLGQTLTQPPNVAGWPGHRNWINTASLPFRKTYSTMILDGSMWGNPLGFQVDAWTEAARFTDPNDPHALVDDLALLLLGGPPTPLVRDAMLNALLQGSPAYAWSMGIPEAPQRLNDLFRFTMRLPDYQLK